MKKLLCLLPVIFFGFLFPGVVQAQSGSVSLCKQVLINYDSSLKDWDFNGDSKVNAFDYVLSLSYPRDDGVKCVVDSDCELGVCRDGKTYEKYSCSNNECILIAYIQDPCATPEQSECDVVSGDGGGTIILEEKGDKVISNTDILPDFHAATSLIASKNGRYYETIENFRPGKPNEIFGLLESEDVCSWAMFDNTLNLRKLVEDYYRAELFYAFGAEGLLISDNDGFKSVELPVGESAVTWLSAGPESRVRLENGAFYITASGENRPGQGSYRIYKSLNTGVSFINISPDDHSSLAAFMLIEPDPVKPNVLYSASTGPDGFYRSVNGGATWQKINNGFLLDKDDYITNVWMFSINPLNTQELYARVNTKKRGSQWTFRSDDRGENWYEWIGPSNTRGINGDEINYIKAVKFDPVDLNTVYIYTNIFNFGGSVTGRLYRSSDRGISYEHIQTMNNGILAFLFDPADHNRFFIARSGAFPLEE